MQKMKGLILSGGGGTRLRPLTYSQQKQLIPVANKPILFYAIEDVIAAGVRDIGIIVGPNKEQVMGTVRGADFGVGVKITFIEQEVPKGLAHTVLISEKFIEDESFVMYLGDNILKEGIIKQAERFRKKNFDASIMLTEVKNPKEFGVAELNGDGSVKQLIEKPKNPPSNLALVGIYFFNHPIIEAVKSIKPSWRNELEITDAIQWLINNGYKVDASIVNGWWKDTGKPEDILHANRLVLDDLGVVSVGAGTEINESSVIKSPVCIEGGCTIEGSCIGPHTSIGKNCKIVNTHVEDSVVMDGAMLLDAGCILDSIIGRGAVVEKNNNLPLGRKFIIGDNSWVRV